MSNSANLKRQNQVLTRLWLIVDSRKPDLVLTFLAQGQLGDFLSEGTMLQYLTYGAENSQNIYVTFAEQLFPVCDNHRQQRKLICTVPLRQHILL